MIFPGNLWTTIFYTCTKATDSTNYLTDAHYHGVHYIRSLMQSQVTTKYEIRGILKIEKAIDATEMRRGEGRCSGCHRTDKDGVQATERDNILHIYFLFLELFHMIFYLLLIQDANMTLFIPRLSEFHFYISNSV